MPDLEPGATPLCSSPELAFVAAALGAIKLLALHLPILFFAFIVARRLLREAGALERSVAALILYFLAIAPTGWGALPVSYPWLQGYALALGIAAAAAAWAKPGAGDERRFSIKDGAWLERAGWLGVILLALGLWGAGLLLPRFDHDAMTYQLHFPACWLFDRKVSIVPTPFGDPSHAYGPAFASVYYLWLLAPLGHDLVAQTGAWPFFVLALLAAAAISIELGVPLRLGFVAPVLCFFFPLLVREARGALSDVALAAFLAAAVFFLLKAAREGGGARLTLGLAGLGLLAGTKYNGALLAILAAPLVLAGMWGAKDRGRWWGGLVGAVLAVGSGGWWYLRNWSLTGSPVYPLEVKLGGLVLFPGLYGRDQMSKWAYHYEGLSAWLTALTANGSYPALLLVAIAMVAALVLAFHAFFAPAGPKAGEKYLPGFTAIIYALILPVLIDRMIWHVFPYQEYRFWLPAVPIACAGAACVLARRPALLAAAVGVMYLGLFTVKGPLPFAGAETLLVLKIYIPFGLALAIGASAAIKKWMAGLSTLPSGLISFALFSSSICLLVSLIAIGRDHPAERRRALLAYEFGRGWEAVECLSGKGLTIAYAGANTPYPLHGPALQNRVLYFSTSGRPMPRDHEAVAELPDPPDYQTPEPAASRRRLCPRAWASALLEARVDLLFIMRVPHYPRLNTAHDRDGWPIEDVWAHSAAGLFKPAYQDEFVRLYQLNPAGAAALEPLSPDCASSPDDAVAVCRSGDPACERLFPTASAVMKKLGWHF